MGYFNSGSRIIRDGYIFSGQKPENNALADIGIAGKYDPFVFIGSVVLHVSLSLALFADAAYLEYVADALKIISSADLFLDLLQALGIEFNDLPAEGADQMVMVAMPVRMFIDIPAVRPYDLFDQAALDKKAQSPVD
jgi:hypothetical protein